jgi:hypothetical protein
MRRESERTTTRAVSRAILICCHRRRRARASLGLGSGDRFEVCQGGSGLFKEGVHKAQKRAELQGSVLVSDGKEGVDGSSPSEASEKASKWPFFVAIKRYGRSRSPRGLSPRPAPKIGARASSWLEQAVSHTVEHLRGKEGLHVGQTSGFEDRDQIRPVTRFSRLAAPASSSAPLRRTARG